MKKLNLNLTIILFALVFTISSCDKKSKSKNQNDDTSPKVEKEDKKENPVEVSDPKEEVREIKEVKEATEVREVTSEEAVEEVVDYSITAEPQIAPGLSVKKMMVASDMYMEDREQDYNTESYANIEENNFKSVLDHPLSTFSIDVDAASYTNTRRFLNNGSLPPKDAVRIEEFINYFSYDYDKPKNEDPFSINTEYGVCPWNPKHQLVHIGLQGKRIPFEEIDNFNLVFLVDVSGSMSQNNKLPLLKKSLVALTKQLRAKDRVAIVVYAGAAGVVLPSTSGSEKQTIINALNNLSSGGSTAGGEGIKLAYKIAQENFIDNGINRILLATDGDFNVGASSDGEMTKLIEGNRDKGISITNLGFGMGNYKDSKMESIADHGNGNYFYIDSFNEARKVLVDELDGTLYTIAKDVKLQVEFNPKYVKGYRLVGYENRMLNKEDFNDDKKDAGELGAGHTVTALYEIIPAGSSEKVGGVDELKYQKISSEIVNNSTDLLTVKFRYKDPNGTKSKLIEEVVNHKVAKETSNNFNFSAAVAQFGMLLRDSKYKGTSNYQNTYTLAKRSIGEDAEGYRAEFTKLVRSAELIED